MARKMIDYVVQTPVGVAVNGATVTITKRSDSSAATVYQQETGGSAFGSNVILTDAWGRINNGTAAAWLDEGQYVFTVTGGSIIPYTTYFEANPANTLTGTETRGLLVQGAVGPGNQAGIQAGGDTTMYRSSAGTWTIPGTLVVGTLLGGIYLDARVYGVKGDNSTDNATPLANFMTALTSAGPGARGILPPGIILTSAPFTYTAGGEGLYVQGHGMGATFLKKTFDGSLVVMQGTGTGGLSESPHLKRFGLEKLTLDGGGHTGMLFDIVYANNMILRDIHGKTNNGPAWDISELWDSRFDHLIFTDVGDTSSATCIFRNRRASGPGADAGGSNVIRVNDLQVENWKGGGLALIDGTAGGNHMDHMYFREIKIESHKVRGSAILVSNQADFVYADGVYVTMQEFDSGFSTPQIAVNFAPSIDGALTNLSITGATTQSIDHGLDTWTGAPISIDNIYGNYNAPGTPSSGIHASFPGGGPYSIGNIANNGATTNVSFAAATTVQGPSGRNVYLGRKQPATLVDGTDKTPVSGTVYYGQLEIGGWDRLAGLSYLIGTVGGTDKVIVTLYDSAGVKLANSATAGTTVGTLATWQRVPFTAAYGVAPGRYFASVSFNGTTARFRTQAAGGDHPTGSATGTFGTLAAITPPTTFTADVAPFLMTY